MKKSVLSLFACGVIAAMIVSSCGGAKYTPLTDAQKQAKADSIFAAKSVDEVKAKADDCTKNMDAAVEAKVQALKAADATAAK